MIVGTILPHAQKFGGVRRFIEIGNRLVSRGHEHRLYVTSGDECRWMEYRGTYVGRDDLLQSDVLLIGDAPSIKFASRFPRNRLFVYVIAGGYYLMEYDRWYKEGCPFLLVNRKFLTRYPKGILMEGAVNTDVFHPRSPRRVGYYAGRGATKGESYIVEQLSGLPGIRLIPIQGIENDRALATVYESLDYLVVWEQRVGWSNMAAEALACGVPVVTNGVNVEPMADRCIVVKDLRKFFSAPMEDLSWDRLMDKLVPVLLEGACQ